MLIPPKTHQIWAQSDQQLVWKCAEITQPIRPGKTEFSETWPKVNQDWEVLLWVHPINVSSIWSVICLQMLRTCTPIRSQEMARIKQSMANSLSGPGTSIMNSPAKFELNLISSLSANAEKQLKHMRPENAGIQPSVTLSKSSLGPASLTVFPSKFKFDGNFVSLSSRFKYSNRYKILYKARQLCCRGMGKTLLWSDGQ